MIAASRIPAGYTAAAKTDRLDAMKLADYLARGWTWRDPEAKAIYNDNFARHGIGQKAIVVFARELAIKLWRMTADIPSATAEGAARGPRSG